MAKGARKVDEAAMAKAEAAKNQLVSQYLHLGSAMKRCSVAVEAYATALNDATSNEEILALLRAPVAGPMPTGMPEMMPFLTAGNKEEASGGKGASSGKKRAASDASEDAEVDENGRKKRKSKKKIVDPDAPKRPPSAYILYQNDIRASIREDNPNIPYQEILAKTGTAWKELGEEKQKPYKDAATKAMADYKANHADYIANGKPDNGDVSMIDELAATPAVKEKKEKAPKKEKEKKAPAPAAAKAEPSTSEAKVPAAKKEKKAAPASAPAPSAVTSTPAAKNAAAPKPVSASTKKNIPQAAAESSSSESDDDEDDSDESSEDSE